MATSRNYHIKLPDAAYKALEAIAEQEKRLLADIIREALEEYVTRKNGEQVSFTVKRGGNRRPPMQDRE